MPMKVDIWTYDDLISHALDYMGAATDKQTERFARRAVQFAMNEMQAKRTWAYYYQIGHINTVASYETGTVEYTHSSKSVTLTGGTWPTWAADGVVVIDNIPYPIVSRTSGTVVVLSEASNPGADVASGSTFRIYRETYTLPVDFGAMDALYRMQGSPFCLTYITPSEFLAAQTLDVDPSEPHFYTVTNDPNRYGVLAIRFRPASNTILPFRYVYRRRPRMLRIDNYSEGTASVGQASTTLTGNGTTWTSAMVGAIVRFSQTAETPTGLSGANPFWIERSIVGFTNATSLTLDAVPGEDVTAKKYTISDPVDVESGAMITYLAREIERQARIIKRMKPASEQEIKDYELSLLQAFEADSRLMQRRAAGDGPVWPVALEHGRVLADA